ncbi:MAG TPA: hypothetical protein VN843_10330 [Anaerolineales bacterium]|nr:hypothetical protein [Anaerolineales bacterium]
MDVGDKTRVTYTGSALPGNAEAITLFSSTVAFGPRAAPHYRCYWFDVALQTDQNANNSLQLQKSPDGGVTWTNAGAAVTINSATPHTLTEFFVSPYADWRVIYTNGATPQTTFQVDMVIDHSSRASAA